MTNNYFTVRTLAGRRPYFFDDRDFQSVTTAWMQAEEHVRTLHDEIHGLPDYVEERRAHVYVCVWKPVRLNGPWIGVREIGKTEKRAHVGGEEKKWWTPDTQIPSTLVQ